MRILWKEKSGKYQEDIMHNMIVFFLILQLLGNGCGLEENTSLKPYLGNILYQDSLEILETYSNKKLGFTFDIPKSWENHYQIKEENDAAHFYFKGKPDNEQLLFGIKVITKEMYNKIIEEDGSYKFGDLVGEKNNRVFIEVFTITVDLANKENIDKFNEMYIPKDEFLKKFHIIK